MYFDSPSALSCCVVAAQSQANAALGRHASAGTSELATFTGGPVYDNGAATSVRDSIPNPTYAMADPTMPTSPVAMNMAMSRALSAELYDGSAEQNGALYDEAADGSADPMYATADAINGLEDGRDTLYYNPDEAAEADHLNPLYSMPTANNDTDTHDDATRESQHTLYDTAALEGFSERKQSFGDEDNYSTRVFSITCTLRIHTSFLQQLWCHLVASVHMLHA